MKQNEWMSLFYKREWYEILNTEDLFNIKGACMYEWVINANEYSNIEIAQENKFTLVETSISFETIISKENIISNNTRLAKKEDLLDILNILKIQYFEKSKFYNRFKNRTFLLRKKVKNIIH